MRRRLLWFAPAALVAPAARAADRPHRMAFQISANDPELMELIVGNMNNAAMHYAGIPEPLQLELVAYGPGLHMLRDDTSPVQPNLAALRAKLPGVTLSVCANTQRGMEARERKQISFVPGSSMTPSGVVRLSELQEQGWSYIRS